eukprot:COSAG05_NODE_1640_length_4358_cov_23.070674_5_plen_170_part_00
MGGAGSGGQSVDMYFPVIERARMHSVGQARACMHCACKFWMSVGSCMEILDNSSHRARACAFSWPATRAHASCMWILDVSWVRSCMWILDVSWVGSCMFKSQILHANSRCRICMAVIEFHAHIMQGAHIFPVNWLCTPFVCNSDHGSLINRILVTGKKWRDCWWRSHTG